MDHTWELRKACSEAIRTCELAEKQAKQAQEAATRQRDGLLRDARQRHTQARQGIDGLLKDMRAWSQQGDRLMSDLKLTREPSKPFVPPSGADLDELTRLLQNNRVQARQAFNRLKAAAEELKEERRQWWKFW